MNKLVSICAFLVVAILWCSGISLSGSIEAGSNSPGDGTRPSAVPNFRTTVFYAEWDDVSPSPAQIDWTAFTHIIVFGTAVNTSTAPFLREAGNISPQDSINFDRGGSNKINWIKAITDSAHAHGVKVYFSVNVGSTFSISLTTLTNNVANRQVYEHYVAGAGGWMARRHLDGIYFDYEEPVGSDTGFKAFVSELRDTMSTWTTPLIGTCVTNYWQTVYADTAWANNEFDQIDIMGYGESAGSSVVGYSSPLFRPTAQYPNYNGTSWFGDTYNQQGVYIGWVNHGIRKNKLGVIIPFEMESLTGNTAPGQTKSGSYSYTYYSTVLNAISSAAALGVSPTWDAVAQVPWIGYTDAGGTQHFYTYENQQSIQVKVDTLKNGGFGGVGVWHLGIGYASNATPPDQLLQYVKSAVGGSGHAPTDTIRPTIAVTNPANGDTVSGVKVVTVNAADNVGVLRVDFLVDGVTVGNSISAPYSYSWNTTGLSGAHTLSAKAYDAAGNFGVSSIISVFVKLPPPDTTPPSASISSPLSGASVTGTVTISAVASDNVGVSSVTFLINNVVIGVDSTSPYSLIWNTSGLTGTQSLTVQARDLSGNTTTSAAVQVTVITLPPDSASGWIYQDSLEAPWRDTSWSATNVYKSTEEVYAGTYSLKTTQSAWGAFSVHSGTVSAPVNIHPTDYSHFEFAIYNTTSGLNLNVYCYNDSGNTFPNVMENNIPTNQWTVISVPMTQLDPNRYPITRVNIQNFTRLNPVYYVDNVHFVDSVAQAPMAPTTTLPPPGADGVSISPVLTWESSPGAVSYRLQIGVDAAFASIVLDDSTITTTYRQVSLLLPSTAYYWRVAAKNSVGTGPFSTASNFITALGNTVASYSLTSVNFGVLQIGSTQVDSLTVRNTGTVTDLVISGIQSTNAEFMVSPQSATIAPGDSRIFTVTAHPTQSQPVSGYLIFTVNTARGLDSVAVQISGVTDVVPKQNLPTQFSLNQNYPNPFNPSTIITFALPTSSYVTLRIYDILGREIATIVNEQRAAGEYREKFAADDLPSGLYLYRLRAGSFLQTGKMMLLK